MNTRKLIKFGKNSFVVSIPKAWIERHHLKKGSELSVDERPGSIILTTGEVAAENRVGRIDCDGKELDELQTEITSLYQSGCTTMIIEGKHLPRMTNDIKDLIRELAGAEIVEQSLHKMIVKDLIDIRQVTIETLINRLDMMIRSMFQDTISEEHIPEEVLRERDRDVNRIQLLIRRVGRLVIEKPAIGNLVGITPIYSDYLNKAAWALERIGDYLKRLNGDINRSKIGAQTRLRGQLQVAYNHYLSTLKSYYQKNFETSLKIHSRIMHALGQYTKHVHEAKTKNEVLALENIKNILRDIRIILRVTIEMHARIREEGSQ